MTRRERVGLYYLTDAARVLSVSWVVFEKALYHPLVRPQLTRLYRKRWGHPRRVRVLTGLDLSTLETHLLTHSVPRKRPVASGSVKS